MLNGVLVAPARLVAEADSLYPVPAALSVRFANVAQPLEAAAVNVPPSVALPGFVPTAIVMLFVAVVTVLPTPSCTHTFTPGVIAAPAAALLGCTLNARRFAAPNA